MRALLLLVLRVQVGRSELVCRGCCLCCGGTHTPSSVGCVMCVSMEKVMCVCAYVCVLGGGAACLVSPRYQHCLVAGWAVGSLVLLKALRGD